MNYRVRTTPGGSHNHSKGKNALPEEAQDQHGTLSSMLGAWMWIAFRTRPYIGWAVTRVPRAVRA
eukprot:11245018-Prorocentrum_lima.AAC.1